MDGTPFSFESWLEGQPDGLGDTENYALFWYKDVPYKWNDGDFGKDAEGRVTFLIEWDQGIDFPSRHSLDFSCRISMQEGHSPHRLYPCPEESAMRPVNGGQSGGVYV